MCVLEVFNVSKLGNRFPWPKAVAIVILILKFPTDLSAQANNDSSIVRMGGSLIMAPTIQFQSNDLPNYNIGIGISYTLGIDKYLELTAGCLAHLNKYSVFNDKAFEPDVKTEFMYFALPANINFKIIRKHSHFIYLSCGLVWGIPLLSETALDRSPIDFMANENYMYSFGLGFKHKFSRNNKLYFGIEPSMNVFSEPIIYGDYYEICNGPFPCYGGKTIGNHSRISLLLNITITNYFIVFRNK